MQLLLASSDNCLHRSIHWTRLSLFHRHRNNLNFCILVASFCCASLPGIPFRDGVAPSPCPSPSSAPCPTFNGCKTFVYLLTLTLSTQCQSHSPSKSQSQSQFQQYSSCIRVPPRLSLPFPSLVSHRAIVQI